MSWQVRINDGEKINSGTSTGVAASYFSFGYGTPSGNLTGENLSAITDINADGYQDLVWQQSDGSPSLIGTGGLFVKYWDPSTNQFETQTRSLGTLPYRFINNYFNVRDNQRYISFKTDTFSFSDVNGDTIPDLVVTPNIQSSDAVIAVRLGKHTNKNANKIVAVKNGLGERKNIFYARINASEHYSRIEGISGSYTTSQRCESVVQNPGEEEYNEIVCWDVTQGTVDATNFYQAINDPWFDRAKRSSARSIDLCTHASYTACAGIAKRIVTINKSPSINLLA